MEATTTIRYGARLSIVDEWVERTRPKPRITSTSPRSLPACPPRRWSCRQVASPWPPAVDRTGPGVTGGAATVWRGRGAHRGSFSTVQLRDTVLSLALTATCRRTGHSAAAV